MHLPLALTIDEERQLQLDILNEVDSLCRQLSLRYSLAFGTLLGAIRHSGYIPWDDDLDIMMPFEDMCILRESIHSSSIRFYDVDTDVSYGNPFGNICSERTFRKVGKKKERGLGIDVYPIVRIPNDAVSVSAFFHKASKLQSRRKTAIVSRLLMYKFFTFCPDFGFHRIIKEYRDFLVSYNCQDSSTYYIIAGPLELRTKMIYDRDLFETISEATFEGKKYPIIKDFDYFLRLRYGDYMQLPPEDQRHPYHGQQYYWK